MLAGEQKELIKDILFTFTRMAAMMQRENHLFLIKVVIHIYIWLDCVPMELKKLHLRFLNIFAMIPIHLVCVMWA